MQLACIQCEQQFPFLSIANQQSSCDEHIFKFSVPREVSFCVICNGYFHTTCRYRASQDVQLETTQDAQVFLCFNCNVEHNTRSSKRDSLLVLFPALHYMAIEESDIADPGLNEQSITNTWKFTWKSIPMCTNCHQIHILGHQISRCQECKSIFVHRKCFLSWLNQSLPEVSSSTKALISNQWSQISESSKTDSDALPDSQLDARIVSLAQNLVFCPICMALQLKKLDVQLIDAKNIGAIVAQYIKETEDALPWLRICTECRNSFYIQSDPRTKPLLHSRNRFHSWKCMHCSKQMASRAARCVSLIDRRAPLSILEDKERAIVSGDLTHGLKKQQTAESPVVKYSRYKKAATVRTRRKRRRQEAQTVSKKVIVQPSPIKYPIAVLVRISDSEKMPILAASLNGASFEISTVATPFNQVSWFQQSESLEVTYASLMSAEIVPQKRAKCDKIPADVADIAITCDACHEKFQLTTDALISLDNFPSHPESVRLIEFLQQHQDSSAESRSTWYCVQCVKRERSRKRRKQYSKEGFMQMEVFGRQLEIRCDPKVSDETRCERQSEESMNPSLWIGRRVFVFLYWDRVWINGSVLSYDKRNDAYLYWVFHPDNTRQLLPLQSLPVLYSTNESILIDSPVGPKAAERLHMNHWAHKLLNPSYTEENLQHFWLVFSRSTQDDNASQEWRVHWAPKFACHAKLPATGEKSCATCGLEEADKISDTLEKNTLVQCKRCSKNFHIHGCCDPSHSIFTTVKDPSDGSVLVQQLKRPYICADCDCCAGCSKLISTVNVRRCRFLLDTVSLCSDCEALHALQRSCSVCYRVIPENWTASQQLQLLKCRTCHFYVHRECEPHLDALLCTDEDDALLQPNFKSLRDASTMSEAEASLNKFREASTAAFANGIPLPPLDIIIPEIGSALTATEQIQDTQQCVNDAKDPRVDCKEANARIHDDVYAAHGLQFSKSYQLHIWSNFQCLSCRKLCALRVLRRLREQDKLMLFSSPVTRDIAPESYFTMIQQPMDLHTMQNKVLSEESEYLDLRFRSFRDDFDLICLNAVTFNSKERDFWIWREAWRFYGKGLRILRQALCQSVPMKGGRAKYLKEMIEVAQRQLPQNSALRRQLALRFEREEVDDKEENAADDVSLNIQEADSCSNAHETEGAKDVELKPDESVRLELPPKPWKVEATNIQSTLASPPLSSLRWRINEILICMRYTREFAHTFAWLDLCVVCGSACEDEDAQTWLFCIDCGETAHHFCVQTVCEQHKRFWRCMNCELCELCGRPDKEEASEAEKSALYACKVCNYTVHGSCLSPPIDSTVASSIQQSMALQDEISTNLIVCSKCIDCKHCQRSEACAKHSPGEYSFASDICFPCSLRFEQEAQTIKRKVHLLRDIHEEDSASELEICSLCSNRWDTKDSVIQCDACEQFVHNLCARKHKDLTRNSQVSYVCNLCRELKGSWLSASGEAGDLQLSLNSKWLWKCRYTIASVQKKRRKSHARWKDARVQIQRVRKWQHWQKHIAVYSSVLKLGKKALHEFALKNCQYQASYRRVENDPCREMYVPRWMLEKARRYLRMKRYVRGPRHMRRRETQDINSKTQALHSFVSVVSEANNCAAFLACMRLLYGAFQPFTNVLLHVMGAQKKTAVSEACKRRYTCRYIPENTFRALFDSNAAKEQQLPMESLEKEIHRIQTCVTNEPSDYKSQPKDTSPSALNIANKMQPLRFQCTRTCTFCSQVGDSPICGRLLYMSDVEKFAHVLCALYTTGVYVDTAYGILFHCVRLRSKSRSTPCHACNELGASIACASANCTRRFHFPCALKSFCVFFAGFLVSCCEACHVSEVKAIAQAKAAEDSQTHPSGTECIVDPRKMTQCKLRIDTALHPIPIDSKQQLQFLHHSQLLCYRIGALTVHSLGEIMIGNPFFHARDAITPFGFRSTRIFYSTTRLFSRCLYECVITRAEAEDCDKGTYKLAQPLFQIVAADDRSNVITAHSADKAVVQLYTRLRNFYKAQQDNEIAQAYHASMLKRKDGCAGKYFFGFGLPEIACEIEQLPFAATTAIRCSRSWVEGIDTEQTYVFKYALPSAESFRQAIAQLEQLLESEHRARTSTGSLKTDGLSLGNVKVKNVIRARFGAKRTTLNVDDHVQKKPRSAISDAMDKPETLHAGRDVEHLPMAMQYRELRRRPFNDRLLVRKSSIHGYGLFTKEAFHEGQAIVEYQGELISQQVADAREEIYEQVGVGSCYLFRLDATTIIDATIMGNLARFINHSCDPKAYARSVTVENDQKKILIFAKSDISAGEEITYDYKFPLEEKALRCYCGTANCMGRMN